MKLPNKVVSFDESILPSFCKILSVLENRKRLEILNLYKESNLDFNSFAEWYDAILCLYFLNAINYDFETGEIEFAL